MASIFPQPPPGAGDRLAANENEMWHILDVLSRCVRAGSDLPECLNSVLHAAIGITSAQAGSLRLWNREAGALEVAAQQGLDTSLLGPFDSLREDEAAQCGIPLKAGERLVVEDVALTESVRTPGLIGALLAAGIRAFQSTPLVCTSGAVVGIISTHFHMPHRPSARQLRLLDALARQAADYVERVQTERALQARTEQFEALIESAPLAVCLVDSSFRVRHANSAAMRMFGASEEIVNRNFEELMLSTWKREYGDGIVRKCRRTLLTGESCTLPEERACRMGRQEQEYHEWRIHRIDLPEAAQGIVCYFRDISPRIHTRMKIHDQEEKLRRVVRLAAEGQIASSLAHEINNPLAAVTNVLYLLSEHADLEPGAKKLVAAAVAEVSRLTHIVRHSLSYYRGGAVVAEIEISALVEERLAKFADRFAAAGVSVTRKIEAPACAAGKAEEIRQVIDNLLMNALEAMPHGGRMAVRVRRSRSWKNHEQPGVRMTVADSGSGIPLKNLRRVFDAFFTTKPEGGRGLGLWVVRGILARHGGSLSVRSREGAERSGTVVSIMLPVAIAQYGTPHVDWPGAAA